MTCEICGADMREPDPGYPEPRPLCGVSCIKVWCERTGSKFYTIEEYAELRRSQRGNAPSEN